MPLKSDDVFFVDDAEIVLSNLELTEEEKKEVMLEWSEEMFEIDLIVYLNGKKAILEGRNSALAALQTIGQRYVMAKSGVKDRRGDLLAARSKLNHGRTTDRIG